MWIIVKTLTIGYMFFRLLIINPLLLLINSLWFHDNTDDLNFMVIDKGNAGATGDKLDKNGVSYISGMLISPGFH